MPFMHGHHRVLDFWSNMSNKLGWLVESLLMANAWPQLSPYRLDSYLIWWMDSFAASQAPELLECVKVFKRWFQPCSLQHKNPSFCGRLMQPCPKRNLIISSLVVNLPLLSKWRRWSGKTNFWPKSYYISDLLRLSQCLPTTAFTVFQQ